MKYLWWGYRHINKTLHVKRYFDREDIIDARKSTFCEIIIEPFEASNRDEALEILTIKIQNYLIN